MTAKIVVGGVLPPSPTFYVRLLILFTPNAALTSPCTDKFYDFQKYVSIQDVVRSHVQAILRPETSGKRYLITAGKASAEAVAFLLRKNFPEQAHRIPDVEDGPIPDPYGLDGRPAESAFGFVYQTLEQTVLDFGKQLFELSPVAER